MNKYSETYSVGTTAEQSSTGNFSVGDLLTISRYMHDSFVSSFRGVPVRVDPSLKGNEWHCAVSKELFEEIKEKYNVKL
jgi:hypothetical protein